MKKRAALDMKIKLLRVFIPVVLVPLLALGVFIYSPRIANLKLTQADRVSANTGVPCTSQITLRAMREVNSPEVTQITVDSGTYRYYVKAYMNGTTPCTTAFQLENGQPWSDHHTNSEGIARVDFDESLPNGRYTARVRPRGRTDIPLSNEIVVYIDNSRAVTAPVVNMMDYYIYNPGDTYIYQNYSHPNDPQRRVDNGKTRLQIEAERTVCAQLGGGIRVRPWRFTKNNINSYWWPQRDWDLRMFWVSPDYVPGGGMTQGAVGWENMIWSPGHKVYAREDIFGVNFAKYLTGPSSFFYTMAANKPGYYLSPKRATLPHQYVALNTMRIKFSKTDDSCAPPNIIVPEDNHYSNHSWKVRIEKTSIPGFSDAIRIDYFEGTDAINNAPTTLYAGSTLLRESWYFARGVGLVKIEQKHFNGLEYLTNRQLPMCWMDSDCLADTMAQPTHSIQLVPNGYTPNKQYNVSVSADGINYGPAITTTRDQGYYLRIDGAPTYHGHVDVQFPNGGSAVWTGPSNTPHKFENGVGKIDITGIPNGVQRGRFRVHSSSVVPANSNESNATVPNIPFSNEIAVTVVDFINQPTRGNFDSISTYSTSPSGVVRGWAFDPNTATSPISVQIYVNGQLDRTIQTNELRTDVNQAYNITGNHGFTTSISLPSLENVTVDIKAVDTTTGETTSIGASPKTVTQKPPAPTNYRIGTCIKQSNGTYNATATWNVVPNTWYYVRSNKNGTPRCSGDADDYCPGNTQQANQFTFTNISPNTQYDTWIHSAYSSNNYSDAVEAPILCSEAVNRPTTGRLETYNGSGLISGWAYDPDSPNSQINVRIYNNGQFVSTISTNILRPDINQSLGISGNHGFSTTIPLLAQENHNIDVKAIDTTTNALLSIQNSPVLLRIAPPKPTNFTSGACVKQSDGKYSVPVSWSPVTNSTYFVRLNKTGTESCKGEADDYCPGTTQTQTSYTYTNLDPNTNYDAWVHAAYSASSFSDSVSIPLRCNQTQATAAPTPSRTTNPTPVPRSNNAVVVRAYGTSAMNSSGALEYPHIFLKINGARITNGSGDWFVTSSYATYRYETSSAINSLEVEYVNDFVDSSKRDRNLVVDYVEVNGTRYQSEAPSTYSDGSWRSSDGCAPGNKSSEWLQCGGYFRYQINPAGGGQTPLPIQTPLPTQVAGTGSNLVKAVNINGNTLTANGISYQSSSSLGVTYKGYARNNTELSYANAGAALSSILATNVNGSGGSSYDFPQVVVPNVPNGTYTVYLYLIENYYPQTYHIRLEGSQVEGNVSTGQRGSWYKKGPYRITVADGKLDVAFRGGIANLSAIEIWK